MPGDRSAAARRRARRTGDHVVAAAARATEPTPARRAAPAAARPHARPRPAVPARSRRRLATLVGARQRCVGIGAGVAGLALRHQRRPARPAGRARRPRRRRPGARARGGRRLDLRQRGRRARRRSALRAAGRARRWRSTTCAVDWSARRCRAAPRALQHRRAHARLARGRGRLRARLRPAARASSSRSARGLARRAPPTSPSTWASLSLALAHRGARALVARLAGALRVAAARTTSSTASSAASWRYAVRARSGLYALAVFARAAAPDAEDAGGVPRGTRAERRRSCARRPRRSRRRTSRSSRRTGCCKERSTAAMECLSATVDARDAYTAGHSRRVQQLALAIGRELGLSQAELDLLGHAALFHDIGKLAVPDAILLKPARLTRRGVGADAAARRRGGARSSTASASSTTPCRRSATTTSASTARSIRTACTGEDIPLGARIIHVADALDSMLTTRIYRAARPGRGGAGGAPPRGRHASSARAASQRWSGSSPRELAQSMRGLGGSTRRCDRAARPLLQMDDFALSFLPWLDGPPASCSSPSTETLSPSFRLEFASAIATRTSSSSCRDPLGGWAGHRRCASSRPTRRPRCTRKR